jgi:hypothetical protein
MAEIKRELLGLKRLLIVLTLLECTYIIFILSDFKIWMKLDETWRAHYILGTLQFGIMARFIWFIWKKMPVDRKRKTNDTFLILLLGIIGMWIWLPNAREVRSWDRKVPE